MVEVGLKTVMVGKEWKVLEAGKLEEGFLLLEKTGMNGEFDGGVEERGEKRTWCGSGWGEEGG